MTNRVTIPSRIQPKFFRLIEDLSHEELIAFMSWLYENQFHLTGTQIARWRELNKFPDIGLI